MLDSKVYDVLKWCCIVCLPAVAVLVSTLGQIWGWADAEKITLTVNAVALFLGALIGVSTYQYNKGKKDE
jgi:hypothetical protein